MARAFGGTVVVLLVPGLLVASLMGLRFSRLTTWAALPVFSLAIVFLLGEIGSLTGLAFDLPTFVALMCALGLATLARRALAAKVHPNTVLDEWPDDAASEPLHERVAYGLLAIGIAIGTLTWLRGIRHLAQLPPGADATREGFMVARIVHSHSIAPSKVLVFDANGAHQAISYYPLAVHASAALVSRLVNADIGRVLLAFTVVFAAIVLPLGMFALARLLAPEMPVVAGFTALVVPAVGMFPYSAILTGDVPLVVGLSILPVTVVVIARTVMRHDLALRWNSRALVVLGPASLAALASVAVHGSQPPLILFLVLLLVLERGWRKGDPGVLVASLNRAVALVALTAILFAPTIGEFLAGATERTGVVKLGGATTHYASTLNSLLMLNFGYAPARQVGFAALALGGAGLWLIRRRTAWVIAWATIVALAFLAATSNSALVHLLTFPWYAIALRVALNEAFFVAFFAGVLLASVAVGLARLFRHRWAIVPSCALVLALVVTSLGVHAYRVNRSFVHDMFSPASLDGAEVDGASIAGFNWLRRHARPDDTVISQVNDGSLWMYALDDVKPLLSIYPFVKGHAFMSAEFRDRVYLLQHVQQLGADARADTLARRYHARWIYYDSGPSLFPTSQLDPQTLVRNPHISLVFHQGTVSVFRFDTI